jgi:hypothetical protein
MRPEHALRAVKLAHTAAWAFFAGCILAIPFATFAGRLGLAATLIAIVTVEVLIILLNRWTCPLTPVAARYTDDRRDNFDIYLPEWLARHNKLIFGVLYALGAVYTLFVWIVERR